MNITKVFKNTCVLALLHLLIANTSLAFSGNQQNSQVSAGQFSEAELAQVLAPIALYPDSLLTHIMIASTYPLELVQAHRWRQDNDHLDAASAVEQAEKEGWDPSVTALVAFPSVLERFNDDLTWTQNLGDAFLQDEVAVLDAVQALRKQAERANSLQNLKNMQVTKVNRQIIIEPIQQEIIYVPYYDTRVVYGNWHWRRYPPTYWHYRPHLSVHFPVSVSGHFHWNAGINIRFNYFFRAFDWHRRHVVVTHHRTTRYANKHTSRHLSSRHRITTSHGAKRWQHNASHRRNVVYRSDRLKSRYDARNHLGHGQKQRLLQQGFKQKQHASQQSKQRSIKREYAKTGQHQRLKNALRKGDQNKWDSNRNRQLKREHVQDKNLQSNGKRQSLVRQNGNENFRSKSRAHAQSQNLNKQVKRKQNVQRNRNAKTTKRVNNINKVKKQTTKKRTKKQN